MKPYYDHAGITIFHGDCREVLPELNPTDLLLTDPPYGIGWARLASRAGAGVITHQTGLVKGKKVEPRDYGCADWDDAPVDAALLGLAISKASWQIIWGGNYFELPRTRCWLIWDKLRGDTCFADGEMAWTNLNRNMRIIRWRWNGFLTENSDPRDERVHPTQKPVAVMHWAIRQAPGACRTVLDPWMGSGTTLYAAKLLGRRAIGVEMEERYCEIAAERLRQEVFSF